MVRLRGKPGSDHGRRPRRCRSLGGRRIEQLAQLLAGLRQPNSDQVSLSRVAIRSYQSSSEDKMRFENDPIFLPFAPHIGRATAIASARRCAR